MADEVAAAVLTDNHAQNATLAVEVDLGAQPARRAPAVHAARWSAPAGCTRSVEALPDDRQLAERRRDGQALTGPELSVLLAYAKLEVDAAVLATDAARRPRAGAAARRLLPGGAARSASREAVAGHPLRREIVATALTNRAVNVAGVTGLYRLVEETGVPLAAVVRAHAVARAVFDIDRMWDAVRPLDNRVPAATQVELRGRGDPAGRAGHPLAAAAAGAGGRAGRARSRP